MKQDFELLVQGLAPVARELRSLASSGHEPTARAARDLLEDVLRKLEDECPRNVSVRAAAEAEREGLGDLRAFHWRDRQRLGGTTTFFWEHYQQVRDMVANLLALNNPELADVAKVMWTAKIAWILREENDRLRRGPREDPARAYREAGIELRDPSWDDSWPRLARRTPPAKREARDTRRAPRSTRKARYERLKAALCPPLIPDELTSYCNVFGPSSGTHYFILQDNGDLSVDRDIAVPLELEALLVDRGQTGHRFLRKVPWQVIEHEFGEDLERLVALVFQALRGQRGGW